MPMVSATDIPLQPFPTGRTSPQAPDAYQQIPTSPAMFGSIEGEALQRAGQEGEKLATEVAKIGAYQQRYLDLAEADKLASERDDERHKEYYGDPAAGVDPLTGRALRPGLKNLYGSEAIDYIKSGAPSKAFDDTVNRIAATASNDTVRQMFLHQSRAQRTAYDAVIGEHWTSQLLAHNEQIQKAKSSIANRDAAAADTDDALIDAIKRNVEAHVNSQRYTDPVLAEAARREATGETAASAIRGKVASGQLDRARHLYDTFRGSFTGQQLDALDKEITQAGEHQRAKEDKEYGERFERFLAGEGPRPAAPGARIRAPAGPPIEGANPEEQQFLNEARFRESSNRYDLIHPPTKDGQTAKGAYGFLDSSWKEATEGTGIGGEYETADKAPPKVQDANALWFYRKYGTKPWAASGPYGGGGALPVASVIANPPTGGADVIERALKMSGQQENSAPLAEYLHNGGVDMDPKTLAWCAGFVNATLAQAGQQGTGSLVATSFLRWGNPVPNPDDVKRGDVAVVAAGLPAGTLGGHVGFATGNKRVDPDTGKPQIEVLAGNERVDTNDPTAGHLVATRWRDADTLTLRRAPGVGAGAASAFQRGAKAASAAPGTATAAPAAAPAGAAPAGEIEIVAGGDSIGVGLNRQNKLAGTAADDVKTPEAALSDAAGSRNPQQGLDYIKTHPERFAGKNVYWSTGLFNAGGPDKARELLPKVEEQLDALKAAGANAVVLVGLDKGRFASLNDDLAKIAAAKGVAFGGPLPTSNIHPSAQGYRDYHAANAALFPPSGSSTPPAAGATPAPPGAGVGEETPPPGPGAAATPAPSAAPPLAAAEPKPAPDWAAQAQRIRDSDLPPGAKTAAFQKLEERKRMFEFGKQDALPKYNAQVHAAVEQRIDDIVQGAARSDDPAVRGKAEQDLTTIIKWGVDSGAIPANKGYEAERTAKTQLVTGRAQYLDAGGKSDEALALIQQNKDTLPPQIYQEQVRNLTSRAEQQQGTRFEREMQIGGGPGYVPGAPTPGMLPGASAESPVSLAPSPLQQKLQAIADSDLPDGAKKAAHAAALSRHELEVVGQDRAKSDLEMAIRKGEAGRPDVEQAYRDGRIAPAARTAMHTELDKIEAERNAEAAALAKVNNAGNGGAPLDPKAPYDNKALNYHFDQVSRTWPADEATARSIDYAAKYGLVPDRLKGLIRGSLHSGSPASMVAAADMINQLRNRNPQLVGEIGDENDRRLATLLQTYSDAGVRPERAVELATSGMKVGKPESDARSQAFDDERGKTRVDQHDSDTSWLTSQLNSIWRADPNVDPVMRKEFEEVSRAEYQRTGNLEASRRMALDNINNLWGRTRVGGDLRYMKQAPEKHYGVPTLSDRENAAWMNEQLATDMRRDALQDPANPIDSSRLHLVQAPDRTAPDGRPAYQVWLEHPTTKQWELVTRPDGQARVWAPDWTSSAEKQRRDAQQAAEIGLYRLQRGMQGAPGLPLAAPGMF